MCGLNVGDVEDSALVQVVTAKTLESSFIRHTLPEARPWLVVESADDPDTAIRDTFRLWIQPDGIVDCAPAHCAAAGVELTILGINLVIPSDVDTLADELFRRGEQLLDGDSHWRLARGRRPESTQKRQ